MSIQIIVPVLGESILEATVKAWMKREGEPVVVGEALVELETDKVNVEVGAERNGVLARIERPEGEDVHVGDVLGVIEETAAQAESDRPRPESGEAGPANGGQPQAAAPAPGSQTGQTVAKQSSPPEVDTRATPVAERIARELRVDLAQVQGTGPGGRVTRENVEQFAQAAGRPGLLNTADRAANQKTPASGTVGPGVEQQPAPEGPAPTAGGRREERIKMSRRRRTIAQRLVEAQRTAAMLTTFNEIDMSAVLGLRTRRNEAFKTRHGVKLGITSFFVKAAIGALKAFPQLNAEIQGDEIILKHYYDIGIAVGATEGLVVPVLRDADRLSFSQIEAQISAFAVNAEAGTLRLEDLRGGTFSITNGGVFGSLLSTPILNLPQVGILGLHKIEPRPVAVNQEVVIRPMMYAALSYDHRIVDGREAVQFLVRVKELVEDPESLLIEG